MWLLARHGLHTLTVTVLDARNRTKILSHPFVLGSLYQNLRIWNVVLRIRIRNFVCVKVKSL
jgi:hypothetical protein